MELIIIKIPNKMFPDSTNLLLYTNIIITDTGEIFDTTPHNIDFLGLKDATDEDYVQEALGENII